MQKAPCAKCDQCPLIDNKMVPSQIVPENTYIVIGERPGIDEIIERMPFVGDSGKVLHKALDDAGYRTVSIGYSNAVLCAVRGDEVPQAAIDACLPRLEHEIKHAKKIAAMGTVATGMLDQLANRKNNHGVMNRAGTIYPLGDNKEYLVTVNPAYMLRNPSYYQNFVKQLTHLRDPHVFEWLDYKKVEWVAATDQNRVAIQQELLRLETGTPMAIDVETSYVQWWQSKHKEPCGLLCIVLTYQANRSIIIPVDQASFFKDTIKHIVKNCIMIAHNGKYDQHVIGRKQPLGLDLRFWLHHDTMLMHHEIQEIGPHDLKSLGYEYLGCGDYEDQYINSWFKANGISNEDRDYGMLPRETNLYPYAAIDGVVTLRLYHMFNAMLHADYIYQTPYMETVMPLSNALVIVEENGIGVDLVQIPIADHAFIVRLDEIRTELNDQVLPLIDSEQDKSGGELARLTRPKTKKDVRKFNPGSHQQVHHVLYNLFHLKLQKRLMKPTSTNTGEEALKALPDHPFKAKLSEYRTVKVMKSTYISSIDRRVTPEGLLHVDFKQLTEVGRLNASNSDHGIPRPSSLWGALIRSLFIAPFEDEVLCIWDYSQAELRTFAYLANVKFLLDAYNNGEDVHDKTAVMLENMGAPLFQGYQRNKERYAYHSKALDLSPEALEVIKDIVKEIRTYAKNVNFGNIYQGGANGIAGMIGGNIPVHILADVLRLYHKLMPEALEYAHVQLALLKSNNGYVETLFGRRRRFDILSAANADEARKAVVHMVVAGTTADLTNHSVRLMVNRGVCVAHTVHDSIIARAKRSEAARIAREGKIIMEFVGKQAMPGVPWVVDLEMSKDGSFPTRWVPKPKIPDRYLQILTST